MTKVRYNCCEKRIHLKTFQNILPFRCHYKHPHSNSSATIPQPLSACANGTSQLLSKCYLQFRDGVECDFIFIPLIKLQLQQHSIRIPRYHEKAQYYCNLFNIFPISRMIGYCLWQVYYDVGLCLLCWQVHCWNWCRRIWELHCLKQVA